MKYLIVGLGNPGSEYAETRHNIGFKVLDALAKESAATFKSDKLATCTEVKFKGRTLVLVKPTTYMNLSGKAVNYWMQAHKIPLENVLVITDDIALPFGKLRMKGKGSDGGHNGLKDIQAQLVKMRDQISGVSIDEETANLMQYQQIYGASAKVIQVADECLKTVLDLRR